MTIGIIGGTGFLQLDTGTHMSMRAVETRYGHADALVTVLGDQQVIFLPRHGEHYRLPPHRINFRANIDALRQLGCDWIIATNAVGSLRPDMRPGDFVLPDQFLDFTKCREFTFYNGGNDGVRFVDMTAPYCPSLCRLITQAADRMDERVHHGATYLCTDGPRFETPAEIRVFAGFGADLVGMTGVPEVCLAREAGICYASVCVVTNQAAGLGGQPISGPEVARVMDRRGPILRDIILDVVAHINPEVGCENCRIPEDSL